MVQLNEIFKILYSNHGRPMEYEPKRRESIGIIEISVILLEKKSVNGIHNHAKQYKQRKSELKDIQYIFKKKPIKFNTMLRYKGSP